VTSWAQVAIPLAGSIIAGGLAIAWKLGGLERSVDDLAEDVKTLQKKVDSQSWRRAR
jgi:hypothetical protein